MQHKEQATGAPADPELTGVHVEMPAEVLDDSSTVVGRFQIVREHAKGGMGRVSVAIDNELNRRVAFKDIQAKFADDELTRHRFTREALITGQLEHPGIIPVYGLGYDAQGHPYYTMRFVEGSSLRDALKEFHVQFPSQNLTGTKAVQFRALLKRFVDVCNAVAFAHSKYVVHRDLKPANVMLGPYGETLVVDWGLARNFTIQRPGPTSVEAVSPAVVQAELETDATQGTVDHEDASYTRTGTLLGTVAYMSPEQAAGRLDTLGPAWDIYSLGATLYEIAAGRAPFSGKPMGELLQDIFAGEYPAPRTVAEWIPKPLESIIKKAMARKPLERYAKALDIAADVEAYLADEPVLAHQDTLGERLRRWARRNRGWVRAGVAASVVVFLILVGSLIAIYQALDREQEENRLKTRALDSEKAALKQTAKAYNEVSRSNVKARGALDTATDQLLTRLLGQKARLGPPEEAFLRKLISTYTELAGSQSQKPVDIALAAAARIRIGDIFRRLGEVAHAAENYKEAITLLKPLDFQEVPFAQRDLATALIGYGSTGILTDPQGGVAAMQEALKLRESLVQNQPNNPELLADYAETLVQVADLSSVNTSMLEAEKHLKTLLDRFEKPYQHNPEGTPIRIQDALARGHDLLGLVYERSTPAKLDAAYKEYNRSAAVAEKLIASALDEPRYKDQMYLSQANGAFILLRLNQVDSAAKQLTELLPKQRKLVEQNPSVREFRTHLVISLLYQLRVLESSKSQEKTKILEVLREAGSQMLDLYERYPEIIENLTKTIEIKQKLADLLQASGKQDEAKQLLQEIEVLHQRVKAWNKVNLQK
jgi:eukaryotic-like serine/threonine-protein kinase